MKCGIGIRPELFDPVFEQLPEFGFLEAHSENYFGESIARARLLDLREHYPISLHGVGLSLGRADDLNLQHLNHLKSLIDEVDPLYVSEHLAWSAYAHRHVPDLLPLPLSEEALGIMCQHVDQMQQSLGRQVLIENPSNYLLFDQLQMPEADFLNTLVEQTGCGLLVDVNNIHVSAANVGRDSRVYIQALNSNAIVQYHLAGYTEVECEIAGNSETVLIDTHNQTVFEPVWELFEFAVRQHGARPTLFEWDSDFPDLSVMIQECDKADQILSLATCSLINGIPKSPELAVTNNTLAVSQSAFLDALFSQKSLRLVAQKEHRDRIWVYQNNVFAAIQEYLAEVYPATRGVVGTGFFRQMVQQYIQTRPPAEGDIHLYGEQLVSVLSIFEGLQGLPYLETLLRYEWALHTAYFSSVATGITIDDYPQDELLVLPIRFNSSVSIIVSEYPIYEIHRQSLPDFEGDVAIDLSQSKDTVLVYKSGYQPVSQVLKEGEYALLKEIKKSGNLLQAIEASQGNVLPEVLSATLIFVFDAGLLQKNNTTFETDVQLH